MQSTNLLIIFLTGLTTGGLTCLALQGGLLASVIASQSKDNKSDNIFTPIFSFLSAKLISHTLLGLILGFVGSSISLSPTIRGWLQIIIGIYLFGIAGNLLNLHPFFRNFVITPPKFLLKLAKNESKSQSVFAPAILGFLTVFIPCATTQAMALVALSVASPIYSAAIMLTFILGTIPTFLTFGFLVQKGSISFKKYFPYVAGLALFFMSIYSINTGMAVMGSVYTIQNFYQAATMQTPSSPNNNYVLGDNTQSVTINVSNSGYSPKNITLKKGIPTKIKLITNNVQSCSRAFTIPSLNIEKLLPETGTSTIEFTPEKTGLLSFACSMGMYTGNFNVVN